LVELKKQKIYVAKINRIEKHQEEEYN